MSARDRLRVLGSKYGAAILAETGDARTAQELSDRLEVPIATCYRRIEELHEVGLLERLDPPPEAPTQAPERYRRVPAELRIRFDGEVTTTMIERTGASLALDAAWRQTQGTA